MRWGQAKVGPVGAIVNRFQNLSTEESRRREDFNQQWEGRFHAFKQQVQKVEQKMKSRHDTQLQQLQGKLEQSYRAEPARFSTQLEELRRMQKVLVRHKRFAEALDILKVRRGEEEEEVQVDCVCV